MRRQYHGNYEGLNKIVLQGIINQKFSNPSKALFKIEKEDQELFDDALLYLEYISKFLVPKSFHIDSKHKFFSSTFDI